MGDTKATACAAAVLVPQSKAFAPIVCATEAFLNSDELQDNAEQALMILDSELFPLDLEGALLQLGANPIQAGIVKDASRLAKLIKHFDKTSASKRHLDYVGINEGQYNFTIGMGHFHKGTQADFFRQMYNISGTLYLAMWDDFTFQMFRYFEDNHLADWKHFWPGFELNLINARTALEHTFLNEDWVSDWRTPQDQTVNVELQAGHTVDDLAWMPQALGAALRRPSVAFFQVCFWQLRNPVRKGEDEAGLKGLRSQAGLALMVRFISSGVPKPEELNQKGWSAPPDTARAVLRQSDGWDDLDQGEQDKRMKWLEKDWNVAVGLFLYADDKDERDRAEDWGTSTMPNDLSNLQYTGNHLPSSETHYFSGEYPFSKEWDKFLTLYELPYGKELWEKLKKEL
jgi:hypothetical protein